MPGETAPSLHATAPTTFTFPRFLGTRLRMGPRVKGEERLLSLRGSNPRAHGQGASSAQMCDPATSTQLYVKYLSLKVCLPTKPRVLTPLPHTSQHG